MIEQAIPSAAAVAAPLPAWRAAALLTAAAMVPPAMLLVFSGAAAGLGAKPGYAAGFVVYWVLCFAAPLVLVGPARIAAAFGPGRPLVRAGWGAWLCLALPLLLAYGYAFPRALASATPQIVALSAALAIVNATLEELMWRGTFLALPDKGWGLVYPALMFGLWHFAPQAVFPNSQPGGSVSFVAVATVLGLAWGYAARRTGTIRWVVLCHILFDFAGLGGRLYLS